MDEDAQQEHWQRFARQWSRLGSPLRPRAEDVEIVRRNLAGGGTTLLLGVTPELAALPVDLVALDNSAAMMDALWTHNEAVRSRAGHAAVRGDWLAMPFDMCSFANVVGDGSATLLSYPAQYELLFAEIGRVVSAGGRVVIRFFLSPEPDGSALGETCAEVCEAALRGRFRSFHAFKWRLSMARAAEAGDPNICVADTWAAFARFLPDRARLVEATGWAMEDIATIDFYRGSEAHYSYPTLAQLHRVLPAQFRELALEQGGYELAECCPTLVMEYRP